MAPTSATADHSAAPPGNKQQFIAAEEDTEPIPAGCAIPAIATELHAVWTTSGPIRHDDRQHSRSHQRHGNMRRIHVGTCHAYRQAVSHIDNFGDGDVYLQVSYTFSTERR